MHLFSPPPTTTGHVPFLFLFLFPHPLTRRPLLLVVVPLAGHYHLFVPKRRRLFWELTRCGVKRPFPGGNEHVVERKTKSGNHRNILRPRHVPLCNSRRCHFYNHQRRLDDNHHHHHPAQTTTSVIDGILRQCPWWNFLEPWRKQPPC